MSAFAHRGQSTCRWGSVSTDAPSGIRLRPDLEAAPRDVGTAIMPSAPPRPVRPRQDVTLPLSPMRRSLAPAPAQSLAPRPSTMVPPAVFHTPIPASASSVQQSVHSVAYAAPSPGVEAIMLAVARAVSSRSEPREVVREVVTLPPAASSFGHRLFLVAATALVAVFGTFFWMSSNTMRVQNAPVSVSAPAPPPAATVAPVVDAPAPTTTAATPPLPPAGAAPLARPRLPLTQSSSGAQPTSGKLASVTPTSAPKTNDDAARAAELLKKQLANSVD